MTRQIIATGSSANDGTGDTLRQAAEKINENFIEVYQKFGGDNDVLSSQISIEDSAISFEGAIADGYETRLAAQNPTADRLVQIPDASGMIVIDTATQTLTNKTLTSPTISAITNSGTLTLPTGTDTIVSRTSTDTLKNKTLSVPRLNSPRIGTHLADSTGNEFFKFVKISSAVNHITITNAATTSSPIISAEGNDTNVGLRITTKGTGSVKFDKVAYLTAEISASADASDEASYIVCNSGTPLAVGLNDGSTVGEFRIFTNKGAGTATVTPDNFAQGTSFALGPNDGCQCVWDGNNWFLIGNQGEVTVS